MAKRYVIWNNKGGVGKSTIVFNLAARYAQLNPKQHVLAIDLCPQANSTMMFLGGGTQGEERLGQLQTTSETVVGYLSSRIDMQSGGMPTDRSYKLQVSTLNDDLPTNLWLVPGDGNLELIAPAISYYANAQLPETAWVNVHRWILNLVDSITGKDDAWVVFIDTNPSFAVYTELAIVAGTHLIVPFKADDSSRVAAKALFDLLYGSNPPHPVYSKYTFAEKAKNAGISLPQCHLFVGNQFTQYKGSAKAFKSMSQAVIRELFNRYQLAPDRYTPRGVVDTEELFQDAYVYELRDFNSAGIVAAHLGRLLSDLQETHYTVHGEKVPLDKARIKDCSESIDEIVKLL